VSSIAVREGQRVQAGQILAALSCHDIEADLNAAAALIDSVRQTRDRMLRGSTDDERSEIADRVSAARAAAREARARYERFAQLAAKDEIPLLDFDRVKLDLDRTDADLRAVEHRQAIVNAPPLPEELARQDAEIRAAEERQKGLLAKLDQCTVRAPIQGTVVRRVLEPGEIFSAGTPKPIVLLADLSRLKIRAEVDERDVGLLYLGQDAEVLVDAFPGEHFAAKVSVIQTIMGRKTVRTGDPAEKSDRDVLEVLLDLLGARPKLPLGLRVTVKFLRETRGLP
jgi:HlyD family secretion protein